MDKTKAALDTFNNKFNCAQAVLSAFAEDLGLEQTAAYRVTACFGGGMRCGEVCGAVTGALMAIGLKYGHTTPEDLASKELANAKAVEFIEHFKAKNDTILCKDLLCYNLSLPEDMQKAKELNLFTTICPRMIADAVEIAEAII